MASADLTAVSYILEAVQGVTPNNGVSASATLTFAGQPADNDTVTINGVVYTFQTTLTDVAGHVKIGADVATTIINLRNAINRGAGAGSKYATSTVIHPDVSASATATTLVASALFPGTSGNAFTKAESGSNTSWDAGGGGTTFSGGTDSSTTVWKQLRYTGETLNFNIENTQSSEIRPDRVQADLVQTSASGAGDVNAELSYGSYDDFLEAALCGTWAANEVKNGATRRFFTVRKHFQDMTPQQYHLFRGTAVEGVNFSMELGAIVNGAFNLVSFGLDPRTGIMSAGYDGESTTPAPTTVPLNAVTNFQDFMIDGVPYSGCLSRLTFALKNNIRTISCLGSLTAKDMRLGRIEVTGEAEFYFNDASVYNKFVKGTELDLNFALEDAIGNRLTFDLPRVKFETAETTAGGQNTDVMVSATYRALYSAGDAYVMKVTRSPA